MTRIVAGEKGGLHLTVPKSGTRPTSERVREAMFSHLLCSGFPQGATVLDLFAGSGALGLEALSRGG
ncbi:RsmD family RNA methyltransferase, partial [uncultured Mobiluncus sp.]